MRIALKMAFKYLIEAGLRTWINVSLLAFCFIVIVFYNGFLNGWQVQGRLEAKKWEYGNGQLYHADYDPYDVFTIKDSHGTLPEAESENLTPVLIQQATVYPNGRMNPTIIKGIPIDQDVIDLPINLLAESDANLPVLIGEPMAQSLKVEKGDNILLRWRDKNGTYDATNITIAEILDSNVTAIDNGQIWMPLEKLWQMTGLTDEATMYIANEQYQLRQIDGWEFHDLPGLLKDFDSTVQAERIGSIIVYSILLALGLLAVFDTQVLSIFRMYSVFAGVVGLTIGAPLFYYNSSRCINIGRGIEGMGVHLSDIIYPTFGATLIIGTFLVLAFSATLVSFIPARKIATLNPANALKGKVQ